MSLTTWLTDYVFMPLNLSFRNLGRWGLYLATLLNLIIVGFWHGANWTYGLFGVYHGLLLVLVTANDKRRKKFEKKHNLKNSPFWKYSRQFLTFVLCTIGFLIFRSASCSDFFGTLCALGNGFSMPFMQNVPETIAAVVAIFILVCKESNDEAKSNIHFLHSENYWVRVVSVALLISYIMYFGALDGGTFIYFQF